jgi:c-di-GMP-binding flagellar brake protein YcgR
MEDAMEIACARCRKPFVKATRRQGLLDRLLSLSYVYPFRCQVCQHRFHLMQWGLRYIERDVDRREYERRRVTLHVVMSTGEGRYEGHTIDLAMGGSAINAYDLHFREGALLSLRLDAFDSEPPIVVDAAVVRIANGTRLGVEFLRIADKEKERLSQYILSLWMEGTQVARKGRLAAVAAG